MVGLATYITNTLISSILTGILVLISSILAGTLVLISSILAGTLVLITSILTGTLVLIASILTGTLVLIASILTGTSESCLMEVPVSCWQWLMSSTSRAGLCFRRKLRPWSATYTCTQCVLRKKIQLEPWHGLHTVDREIFCR